MEHFTHQPDTAFSGHDLAKELEKPTAEQLAPNLLRDFYQTFRLAQGNDSIQRELMYQLAEGHRLAGHADALPEAASQAGAKAEQLMPPKHHKDTSDKERADPSYGFKGMWRSYQVILTKPEVIANASSRLSTLRHENPEVDSGRETLQEMVVGAMMVADLKYQEKPRPGRTGDADIHESHIREYILGDKLTGSAQLMAVRNQLRDTLPPTIAEEGDDTKMQQLLTQLARRWEENHPGQKFFS